MHFASLLTGPYSNRTFRLSRIGSVLLLISARLHTFFIVRFMMFSVRNAIFSNDFCGAVMSVLLLSVSEIIRPIIGTTLARKSSTLSPHASCSEFGKFAGNMTRPPRLSMPRISRPLFRPSRIALAEYSSHQCRRPNRIGRHRKNARRVLLSLHMPPSTEVFKLTHYFQFRRFMCVREKRERERALSLASICFVAGEFCCCGHDDCLVGNRYKGFR